MSRKRMGLGKHEVNNFIIHKQSRAYPIIPSQ